MSWASDSGDAGAFGDAERGEAGAGVGEEAVGVAVIAAAEFEDVVALGDATGEANSGHGGFGAAGDEADFFERGDGAIDEGGEFDFELGGDAEAGATCGLRGDGLRDLWIGVAEEERAPGADEIEVAVAVGVVEILGFAAVDDERVGLDGAEGADGRVDAADEQFFGAGEDFARAWAGEFGFGLRGGHWTSSAYFKVAEEKKITQRRRVRGGMRRVRCGSVIGLLDLAHA